MVDITRLSPYGAPGWPETELPASSAATSGARPQSPASAGPGEDRVELVRAQNLESPQTHVADLEQALVLMRQVSEQMAGLEKQELRQLYQFDRLRELCCSLQEPVGA